MGYEKAHTQEVADFIVYKRGTLNVCKNGNTGAILKSDTDAQVVIQAAIDEFLPGVGGKVYIAPGLYGIERPIKLYKNESTWTPMHIQGANPYSTRLRLVNNADCNVFENIISGANDDGFKTISWMEINGNWLNNAAGSGYYQSKTGSGSPFDTTLDTCFFMQCKDSGIYYGNGWGNNIHNCISEYCTDYALYANAPQTYVENCFFAYTGIGAYIDSNVILNANFISLTKGTGILAQSVFRKVISNNIINAFGDTTAFSCGIDNYADETIIANNTINGNNHATAMYGVRMRSTASHCIVSGNTVSGLDAATGKLFRDDGDYNVHSYTNSGSSAFTLAGNGNLFNNIGVESANAETPQLNWRTGAIVDFTDSGDASGDGIYIKDTSGTWVKIN